MPGAACGNSNAEISRRRGVALDTVRLWRGRYADEGTAGLADRRRCGRPPRFTPVQAAEVKALACQLQAEDRGPLSRWSCLELRRRPLSNRNGRKGSASSNRVP